MPSYPGHMTRRRKDPFAGKENVRHFRLVQRPLGAVEGEENSSNLNFDEMFEEYDPSGLRRFDNDEKVEEEFYEEYDETANYDFINDDDGELVDIDAELDQFAEDFVDIEGEEGVDRVKMDLSEGKVGEAAKYGILLDDRDYDYTKHLRHVGITPGAVFIQAPGTKKSSESYEKKQTRDFFSPVESEVTGEYLEESNEEISVPEDVLKANHEAARHQFRTLLQQVGDNPILREVIEALEDDRYVTEEIDDELVIMLDNLNFKDNEPEEDIDEFFDDRNSDIEILDEDEKFPDFIPSEALKRQMEKIAAQEADYSEFDEILNEYNEDTDENDSFSNNYSVDSYHKNELIDIEAEESLDEEAEAVYKYLKEHGRARGTTLYDKKRPNHLPPIHIAIAQYNELRRELAVNNDMIIQKYAEEDEEETRRQIQESEKIISEMVKTIDDPIEMEKRLNIQTAKYLMKLSEGPVSSGPKKIIETGTKQIPEASPQSEAVDSDSDDSDKDFDETPKENKGAARSVNESAEEKRARKAKIKAEKRDKRLEKKNRN